MNKLKELIEDLKRVTNLSQPNIRFKDQMDLIEALDVEVERLINIPFESMNLPNEDIIESKSEHAGKALNEVIEQEILFETQEEPIQTNFSNENAEALAKVKEIAETKKRGRKKIEPKQE